MRQHSEITGSPPWTGGKPAPSEQVPVARPLLAILLMLLAGCGAPSSDRPVERLVILHFENLSTDPAADWAGVALATLAAEQLAGSPSQYTEALGSVRDAATARATQVIDGYFDISGDEILLSAEQRDTETNRATNRWRWRAPFPGGLPDLVAKLAGAGGIPPRPPATASIEAIKAYSEASIAQSADEKEALLRQAIETDPDFVQPIVALGSLLAIRGQSDEARALIEPTLERDLGDEITAARLRYLIATLDGDQEAIVPALEAYAQSRPADVGLAEQTANSYLARHHYDKAADWFGRATQLDPKRAELWNARAYPLAYSGDFAQAVASLERYRETAPDQPNVKDSLGEIHFRFGHNQAAEQYFLETFDQAPDFQDSVALVKAARCRLMSGDLPGADQLMDRYVQRRRDLDDPGIDFRHAQWRFWTGRRSEAMNDLQKWAATQDERPDLAALAHSQLALWALLLGDREQAEQYAESARHDEQRRSPTGVALLAQFISRPPATAEEWSRRAQDFLPHPQQQELRKELLLHVHLLDERLDEAGPLLEEIIAAKKPFAHDEFDVVLGWLRLEAGDLSIAERLLSPNPIVQPGAESPIYSFVFPKILYLRGRLAAKSGDPEEARRNLTLFLELSGDTPLRFGDEARARELLAELGT